MLVSAALKMLTLSNMKRKSILVWGLLLVTGFSAGALIAAWPQQKAEQASHEKRQLIRSQKDSLQSCGKTNVRAAQLLVKPALPRKPHD